MVSTAAKFGVPAALSSPNALLLLVGDVEAWAMI